MPDLKARFNEKILQWLMIYAFGGTFLIVALAALFDNTELLDYEYRPRIGQRFCILDG